MSRAHIERDGNGEAYRLGWPCTKCGSRAHGDVPTLPYVTIRQMQKLRVEMLNHLTILLNLILNKWTLYYLCLFEFLLFW